MISINFTLFVQIAHFLVLVWIMNRILIRPVVRHLEEKEKILNERQANITSLEEEARDRDQSYRERLAEAYRAANAERDKMLTQARAEASQRAEKAGVEAKGLIERIRQEITSSLAESRQSLEAQKDVLAEQLAAAYAGRG
ncbi:MAG: hypothetical protein JRC92_01285 [Deltaproteobacteria bacterium]|nr:hypothetical protein [Deltaproteobacteria bacterium]